MDSFKNGGGTSIFKKFRRLVAKIGKSAVAIYVPCLGSV